MFFFGQVHECSKLKNLFLASNKNWFIGISTFNKQLELGISKILLVNNIWAKGMPLTNPCCGFEWNAAGQYFKANAERKAAFLNSKYIPRSSRNTLQYFPVVDIYWDIKERRFIENPRIFFRCYGKRPVCIFALVIVNLQICSNYSWHCVKVEDKTEKRAEWNKSDFWSCFSDTLLPHKLYLIPQFILITGSFSFIYHMLSGATGWDFYFIAFFVSVDIIVSLSGGYQDVCITFIVSILIWFFFTN